MKYYITGSKGFVGTALTTKLMSLGHEVSCFYRNQELDSKTEFDYVINCAAEIHAQDHRDIFQSNVTLTYELLTRTKYKNFIQIGSSSEYGLKNNGTPNPFDLYSGTKAASSMLALSLGGTVVRPYSLYGIQDRKTKLIPFMINKLFKGEDVNVYVGDHDWVYIDDFIDAIIYIMENKLKGSFDVCTGVGTSNGEIVRMLKDFTKSTSKVDLIDSRYRSYDRCGWVGDVDRNPVGWKAHTSIKDGLLKCVNNYDKE